MDGSAFLQVRRSFILKLDKLTFFHAEIAKSFDTIAIATMLSVKVTSPLLKGKQWFTLFEAIVTDGFQRRLEFEITNVQKSAEGEFA